MDNAYLATAVVLRELKCHSIKDINDRVLLQKKVFLAQDFGITLGYGYNWYLYGPYSPDLTAVAYKIIPEGFDSIQSYTLNDKAKKIIERVNSIEHKNTCGLNKTDWFELVASVAFWYNLPLKENVIKRVEELKPKFNEDDIQKAFTVYQEIKNIQ